MIELTRKPVPLSAFRLTEAADMLEALTTLSALGWRGAVNADEVGGIRLELNADSPTRQIIAGIGDVIVDDLGWRKVSAAEAEANYDEASP